MKIYRLEKSQKLPISIEEAWSFFSSPKNLQTITPDDLDFKIVSDLKDERMYPGQIINYVVGPFPGVKVRWTTEITHIKDKKYFVDEQRFGPYAFWHHKHFFKTISGGVEIRDVVDYAVPFGFLGRSVHPFLVRPKLDHIFNSRFSILEKMFGSMD